MPTSCYAGNGLFGGGQLILYGFGNCSHHSGGGCYSSGGGVLRKNASGGIPLRVPRASRKITQSTANVSNNAWDNFRLGNLTAEHVANKSNATSAKRQKRPAEDIQLSFDHA